MFLATTQYGFQKTNIPKRNSKITAVVLQTSVRKFGSSTSCKISSGATCTSITSKSITLFNVCNVSLACNFARCVSPSMIMESA